MSTTTIVNCPVVPLGSTATRRYPGSGSAGLIQGWYKNSIIYYFSFLEAPLALTAGRIPTAPIFVTFAQNGNPDSGFMTDASGVQTHNVPQVLPNKCGGLAGGIVDTLYPGFVCPFCSPGYSPLWNVYIYSKATFAVMYSNPQGAFSFAAIPNPRRQPVLFERLKPRDGSCSNYSRRKCACGLGMCSPCIVKS